MRMLGLKSGPLQKQCMLLTAEPRLQPGTLLFDTGFVESLGGLNAQVTSEYIKEYILKSIYASAQVPVEVADPLLPGHPSISRPHIYAQSHCNEGVEISAWRDRDKGTALVHIAIHILIIAWLCKFFPTTQAGSHPACFRGLLFVVSPDTGCSFCSKQEPL